jgi:hypothetical protein
MLPHALVEEISMKRGILFAAILSALYYLLCFRCAGSISDDV